MVRSIRFWGLASKLIVECEHQISKAPREYAPTSIGSAIFGENGSDKYLEDCGTLWLIHWLLLAPRSRLPVWWVVFNEFSAVEFTEEDLKSAVTSYFDSTPEFPTPSQSAIGKDINVLLRTYTNNESSKTL